MEAEYRQDLCKRTMVVTREGGEKQSFKEIYNGDKANKFREEILKCEGHIFPGCVRCYQNMLFGEKVKGY